MLSGSRRPDLGRCPGNSDRQACRVGDLQLAGALLGASEMGYPLRFYGAGQDIEIDGVRIPGRCTVEVTFRTLNEQYLLRPDRETKAATLACLGRAYARHPGVCLHVASVLSNHGTLYCTPDSAGVLSDFMRDFMSSTATKVNRLRGGRRGPVWARRYRAIPVLGEAKLVERFAYVLTQGTKENLVWSARDWPGVQSVDALLGGAPLVGYWRDRRAESEQRRQLQRKRQRAARRRGAAGSGSSAGLGAGLGAGLDKVEPKWIEYPIPLVPPPQWAHLPVGQQRARVADIVRRDDELTRARHQRDGTKPLGRRGVLAMDPFAAPANPKRSPAPLVHAPNRRVRRAFRKAHRAYGERYRASRQALTAQVAAAGFLPGTTTPPLRCPPEPGGSSASPAPPTPRASGPPRAAPR
jgi:hypothetical protein